MTITNETEQDGLRLVYRPRRKRYGSGEDNLVQTISPLSHSKSENSIKNKCEKEKCKMSEQDLIGIQGENAIYNYLVEHNYSVRDVSHDPAYWPVDIDFIVSKNGVS